MLEALSNRFAPGVAPLAAPWPPPALVLDTNVVLDWLVFDDPGAFGVAAAIAAGRVRWLASAAMRDELEQVLGREALAPWSPDPTRVLAAWQRWVTPVEAAPSTAVAPALQLRCSDRDDQKFIDLALQCGAHALLSRDRAVLRLARRASARGLRILTAAAWTERSGTDIVS